MSSAGYSGTPLIRKLGIKEGFRCRGIKAPEHFEELIGPLPEGARWIAGRREMDYVHVFATNQRELRDGTTKAKSWIHKQGTVWVSWPKGKSSIASEINREDVREVGLQSGLVDVKVAALDEDWSGLKFVYRLKDR